MNDEEKIIHEHIVAFIAAYESWETDAYNQFHASGQMATGNTLAPDGLELLDRISQLYAEELRAYFVDGAEIRSPGFSKPLTHESAFEHILSITKAGDQFVVLTEMTRQNGPGSFTETYQYSVVFENEEPKIAGIEWSPQE